MARKRRAAALAAVSNWEAAVMDAIPSGGEGGGKRGASDFDLEKEENATKGQQRRRKERHRYVWRNPKLMRNAAFVL